MAASSTATLAAANAIRTHNHAGETVQYMEYIRGNNGGGALTKDVATTFMITRIPAWSVITGVDVTVHGGLAGGTHSTLIGANTLITSFSITNTIVRLATHTNVTTTASATATLWRYLNVIVTPGSTTTSLVISAVVRYLAGDPYEGPGRGVAGSG